METQNAIVLREVGGDLMRQAPRWLRRIASMPLVADGYPRVRVGLELTATVLEAVGGSQANAPVGAPAQAPPDAPQAAQAPAGTTVSGTGPRR